MDKKELEHFVAQSPIAQCVLDYLSLQEGFVDYVFVMNACAEKGYDMVQAGIVTGKLMGLGMVDDRVDPNNENRFQVSLHREEKQTDEIPGPLASKDLC